MNILRVRCRNLEEFEEHYLPDVPTGGVFCPTTTELPPGTPVVVEMACDGLPNKVLIRGIVTAWRPALPRMRVRAGATIDLASNEQIKLTFLHDVFSGKRKDVPRRRHHRLPIEVTVRYRLENSASWVDCALIEVGVGGALLATPEPLPIDTALTLEIVPPGAAAPLAIACRVSYHTPPGGSGLRFMTRDGDGDRRLRELIRRLRAA